MNSKEDPSKIELHERLASGAIAGAISQFLMYPLDSAKIRLALSHNNIYHSFGHLMGRIYAQEGLIGYYRGLMPSLYGVMI